MNRLIITGRVLAALTLVVGIVHEAMTFLPIIADGFARLTPEWQATFTYFSLCCGGMVMMCGVLSLMLLRRVARHEFFAAPLVAVGVFAAINGALAICFMLKNPFAWVVLSLGLGLFFTAIAIRAEHRKE